MTQNQREYKKQINRIKNFIKRKEKDGFIFTELPKDMPSLAIPKRVTKKALENIQSFRTKSLYAGSIFVSEEGTTSGLEEVRRRKKASNKKRSIAMRSKKLKRITPDEARQKGFKIIEYVPKLNLIDKIRQILQNIERKAYPKYDIEGRKGLLLRTFEDSVNIYDPHEFIKYLQENEADIMAEIQIIEYDSSQDSINASFLRLMMILNVANLSEAQLEEVSEFSEYFNSDTEV